MKKNLLLFMLLTAFILVKAQTAGVQASHYVFPEFQKGTVLFKNGGTQPAHLNYNIYTQELVFMRNGVNLALTNTEKIDTIYIGSHRFVPVKKKYYELVVYKAIPLFIEYTCDITPPGKVAAYGGTSQLSASSSLFSLLGSSGIYQLKLPDDYKISPYLYFWTKKDDVFCKVNSAKQLIKLFPEKENDIKRITEKYNIKFKTKEEVEKLFQLLN